MGDLKEYTIYWKDGSFTQSEGTDPNDALRNIGHDDPHNSFDMITLGSYDPSFQYSEIEKRWINTKIRKELSGFIK